MVFSSIIFLCMFLPVVMAAYFICPRRFRNLILLISSLFFYAWGEPVYILIMLFSTVFDYMNGLLLEWFDVRERFRARKVVIVVSVVVNLGILGFFKYTDFFISNINELTGSAIGLLQLALPIGISFYTFQTLSYTIDVYRRKVKTQHNLLDFATYISMFPQLIAGPIVRYSDVEKDIHDRKTSLDLIVRGAQRFLLGLGKRFCWPIRSEWYGRRSLPWDSLAHPLPGWGLWHIPFRYILIFPDIRIWRWDLDRFLGSISRKTFAIPISLKVLRNSGADGILL